MEKTIKISEIQEVEILDIADIKTRVTKIIYKAINIYIAKLKYGYLEPEKEATFQHNLAKIIDDLLQSEIYAIGEKFIVSLEYNIPLVDKNNNQRKNYVDIVIRYFNNNKELLFPIELKFKNKYQNNFVYTENVNIYFDLQTLNNLMHRSKIAKSFFIFFTNDENYTNQAEFNSGQLYATHMFKIYKKSKYDISNNETKKWLEETKNWKKEWLPFEFNYEFSFFYKTFEIKKLDKSERYWYFINEFDK